MLIGPAMLVALLMVMSAVLPLLPSVKPLTPLSVRYVNGQDSAEVKLVLDDCSVNVPLVLTNEFVAGLVD